VVFEKCQKTFLLEKKKTKIATTAIAKTAKTKNKLLPTLFSLEPTKNTLNQEIVPESNDSKGENFEKLYGFYCDDNNQRDCNLRKFTGKTSTAIIPFPEGKILLVKRDTVPFKGYWALPGGRMDPGETVEQTIVRECKEETGLDVEIVRKIGEYVEKGVKDEVEYEYYPTCFLVKVVGGEIKRQEGEIQEIRLFRLQRMPNQLAFEHIKMIEDYMNPKE